MRAIEHEPSGVDLPAGLGAAFAEDLEEEFAVFFAEGLARGASWLLVGYGCLVTQQKRTANV